MNETINYFDIIIIIIIIIIINNTHIVCWLIQFFHRKMPRSLSCFF